MGTREQTLPTLLLLLLGALSASCASDDALAANTPASGGSSATGGSDSGSGGDAEDQPTSLQFAPVDELGPRSQVTLHLQATPPGVYHVSFSLPASEGEPLDAILDRAETDTDALGKATLGLTAPSKKTSFRVRASVDHAVGLTNTIDVNDQGYTTVQVQPRYVSGVRDITTWIATAHVDESCAALSGIPPKDGNFASLPADKASAPLIAGVPANKRLAITLRSGHFVGGCTTVEGLPPGTSDSPPEVVEVVLLNRPVDLSSAQLAFSLDLAESDTTLGLTLSEAATRVLAVVEGETSNDVGVLLDEMQATSGVASFAAARSLEGWDARLRARWGATAETKLRDVFASRLSAGQAALAMTHLFSGALSAVPQLEADVRSSAKLSITSVAGIPALDAGFVDLAQVSWSAGADDTVLLGTDLYFVRTQLAAALAEKFAAETNRAAVAAALSKAVDCAGIGSALATLGDDALLAYGDCNGECLASLCQNGVAALWRRGADADALSPSRMSVTATGKVYVGDTAEVVGVKGDWIGNLSGHPSTGGGLTMTAQPTTR